MQLPSDSANLNGLEPLPSTPTPPAAALQHDGVAPNLKFTNNLGRYEGRFMATFAAVFGSHLAEIVTDEELAELKQLQKRWDDLEARRVKHADRNAAKAHHRKLRDAAIDPSAGKKEWDALEKQPLAHIEAQFLSIRQAAYEAQQKVGEATLPIVQRIYARCIPIAAAEAAAVKQQEREVALRLGIVRTRASSDETEFDSVESELFLAVARLLKDVTDNAKMKTASAPKHHVGFLF